MQFQFLHCACSINPVPLPLQTKFLHMREGQHSTARQKLPALQVSLREMLSLFSVQRAGFVAIIPDNSCPV